MRHNMYTQSKHPKQQTTSQFYKSSLGMGVFSQHKKLLAARTPLSSLGRAFPATPTELPSGSHYRHAGSVSCQPASVGCVLATQRCACADSASVHQCVASCSCSGRAVSASLPPCQPASAWLPPALDPLLRPLRRCCCGGVPSASAPASVNAAAPSAASPPPAAAAASGLSAAGAGGSCRGEGEEAKGEGGGPLAPAGGGACAREDRRLTNKKQMKGQPIRCWYS